MSWKGKKKKNRNQGIGGVEGRSGHLLLHVEVSWRVQNEIHLTEMECPLN
jgi:hypothetical protein